MSGAPPFDREAERAVLSTRFVLPGIYMDNVAVQLRPEDFFVPFHREVFEVMETLETRRVGLSPEMICAEMRRRGGFEADGEAQVHGMMNEATAAVGHFAEMVREYSNLRRMILACGEAAARAAKREPFGELMEVLAYDLSLIATGDAGDIVRVGELTGAVMHELRERMKDPGKIRGVRFGLEPLDQAIFGLQGGEHCILAADVGGGKSALAVQAGITTVLEDDGTCMDFTLEMTKKQLVERVLAYLARVNSGNMRRGRIDPVEWRRIEESATDIGDAPFYLEDRCFRLPEIAARMRRWRRKHPKKKGLGIVDFVQLVRAEERKGESRARSLGALAYAIKELAKELDVPIISVSQLVREAVKVGRSREGGDDKLPPRPTKHDLRDSGELEASADQIVFIYNPKKVTDGPVEIIIDKNRSGGVCGTVPAHWTGKYYRFTGGPEQNHQPRLGLADSPSDWHDRDR